MRDEELSDLTLVQLATDCLQRRGWRFALTDATEARVVRRLHRSEAQHFSVSCWSRARNCVGVLREGLSTDGYKRFVAERGAERRRQTKEKSPGRFLFCGHSTFEVRISCRIKKNTWTGYVDV